MKILTNTINEKLVLTLEGRLDTNTSPQLEEGLNNSLQGITELIFDFESLIYISSAGLRIILATQKKMNESGGKMVVKNVNDSIMDIFEMTGFVDILTIE